MSGAAASAAPAGGAVDDSPPPPDGNGGIPGIIGACHSVNVERSGTILKCKRSCFLCGCNVVLTGSKVSFVSN